MEEITRRFQVSYLRAVGRARGLLIGRRVARGGEGLLRLAGAEEAGLDAAQGSQHPAVLAPDLPLELIPLAGDHVEDLLQTCRVRGGGTGWSHWARPLSGRVTRLGGVKAPSGNLCPALFWFSGSERTSGHVADGTHKGHIEVK